MREPLRTIGLWGDGDELDAVQDAERRLGFKLPVEEAPNWLTVGDIYDSVMRHNPGADARRTWRKLVVGLCVAVGADPRRVAKETTLIERTNIWKHLADLGTRVFKGRSHD